MASHFNPINTTAVSLKQTNSPLSCNTLAAFLKIQTETKVLKHILGYRIADAPLSLNDALVICLNLEWWEKEPHLTTELGIGELAPMGPLPGVHAQNHLQQIRVAHARIMEHAHLVNHFPGAGDPEKFHFGTSKFVTMHEAHGILKNTFLRPSIITNDFRPIILLVHGAENKINHVKEKMNIDIFKLGTVVKVVDTQKLAKEANIGDHKNIKLQKLVNYFHLQPDNLHTAGNAAGYTMIMAILTALKNELYPYMATSPHPFPPRFVQGVDIRMVINHVMVISKSVAPPWGKALYCTRCGLLNHLRAQCKAKVTCSICKYSRSKKLEKGHMTHATSKCLYHYWAMPDPDEPPRVWAPPVTTGTLPIPPKSDSHGQDMNRIAQWAERVSKEAEETEPMNLD
jgi:hypothetical protein